MDAFFVQLLVALLTICDVHVSTAALALEHSLPHIVNDVRPLIEGLIGDFAAVLVAVAVHLVPHYHAACQSEVVGSPNDDVLAYPCQFVKEHLLRRSCVPVFLAVVGSLDGQIRAVALPYLARLHGWLVCAYPIRRVGNRQLKRLVGQGSHVLHAISVEYFIHLSFSFWR